MKIFKIIKALFSLFSFSLLLSILASVHSITIDVACDADAPRDLPRSYTFSCSYDGRDDLINFCGEWCDWSVQCTESGHYRIVRQFLCGDMICDMVKTRTNNYKIELREPSACEFPNWRMRRLYGCSYWRVTPQGVVDLYRRKIFIKQIGDGVWDIIGEALMPGGKMKSEKIVTLNFPAEIRGELADVINFVGVMAELLCVL